MEIDIFSMNFHIKTVQGAINRPSRPHDVKGSADIITLVNPYRKLIHIN